MSECKHETWNSVSPGLKWACGECGKFESVIINELRQQLAAEQDKNVELERNIEYEKEAAVTKEWNRLAAGFEFTDDKGNLYRVYWDGGDPSVGIAGGWICDEEFHTPEMVDEAIKEATVDLQATMAAMRSALEKTEILCRNSYCRCVTGCEEVVKIRAVTEKALSTGEEHAKEYEELKAERNKFQKELFELEDKYKQAYGWEQTAKDTAAHLQAAENRVKNLEEAAHSLVVFCSTPTGSITHLLDKVKDLEAVLGEGKADA